MREETNQIGNKNNSPQKSKPQKDFKPPGLLKKVWYWASGQPHKIRVDQHLADFSDFESNHPGANIDIIKVDSNTVVTIVSWEQMDVVATKENEDGTTHLFLENRTHTSYSVFRKLNGRRIGHGFSSRNDDVGLTYDEFKEKFTISEDPIDVGLPASKPLKAGGLVLNGSKNLFYTMRTGLKIGNRLLSFRKSFTMPALGFPDVLKKGFHMHYKGTQLELILSPTHKLGQFAIKQWGRKGAKYYDEAYAAFREAFESEDVRQLILIRAIATRNSLLTKYVKGMAEYSQAQGKAAELTFLIKSLESTLPKITK